jgi:enoyl-CoA hydratase/carnithine racemase
MIVKKEGGIGWMIFNNPARHNAVSMAMWEAVPVILADFAKDPEVRVVILAGAGEKAFVSGADISEFKEARSSAEASQKYNAAADAASVALKDCPKPTIAMIRGYCYGGGVGIAIGCDIRIASDDSAYSIPAAKLGVGYRYVGIKRLADLVGFSFVTEIFYTGRRFSGQEALAMGLINRLLPVAELESYTREYANTIVNNAPLTIAAVKRCIIEYLKDDSERDVAAADKVVNACFASADYIEGRDAFMQKRKPVFKGQ